MQIIKSIVHFVIPSTISTELHVPVFSEEIMISRLLGIIWKVSVIFPLADVMRRGYGWHYTIVRWKVKGNTVN